MTTPSNVTLRIATAADAPALSAIGRSTFAETFGHLYPPEDLAAFLEGHAPEHYVAWANDPAYRIWLAEQAGQVIGYAFAGPCNLPHADVTTECGELKRIYVDKRAQGAGAGSLLLKTALDWLQTPGRTLWIGVWSENHGAQRLYGRHGFRKVGTYEFEVGESRDHEFVLRRLASEIPASV